MNGISCINFCKSINGFTPNLGKIKNAKPIIAIARISKSGRVFPLRGFFLYSREIFLIRKKTRMTAAITMRNLIISLLSFRATSSSLLSICLNPNMLPNQLIRKDLSFTTIFGESKRSVGIRLYLLT